MTLDKIPNRGYWMAQLVTYLALGFSSGRGLRVVRSSPMSGSVLSMESACPSPSGPLTLSASLKNTSKNLKIS